MPKATYSGGLLTSLENCYIHIPNATTIRLRVLPDISDSKSATYNDETVPGRSFPMKTFAHSDNRSISMQLHFVVTEQSDISRNLSYLRALESAVYPLDGFGQTPFIPPPVCSIRCGELLGRREDVCVVLRSYAVRFPTDVAWDEETYCPYKFDVDTTWEVVYETSRLPGQDRIINLGV